MKKKLYLTIIIIMVVILTSGCVTDGLTGGEKTDKEYRLLVKLINSSDELIRNENIKVTIDGKEGSYKNGVYTFKLKDGSYTVKASDPSNSYSSTSNTVIINGNDTITKLHLFKNSKSVVIKSFDENSDLLKRTDMTIKGVDKYKTEEGYQFALNVGEEYTVKINDPHDFYKTKEKTFKVTDSIDTLEVNLNKRATGTIEGRLYLPEKNNSGEIVHSNISYYDKEITSDDTGYKIELPVGERKITVNTVFGGKTTKTVNIKENQTINEDITVPLPDDFPVEKWKNEDNNNLRMVSKNKEPLVRWDKKNLKYYIKFVNFDEDINKEPYKIPINKSVNIMDYFMKDLINFEETNSIDNADIVFEVYNNYEYKGSTRNDINNYEIEKSRIILDGGAIYSGTYKHHIPAHELGHTLGIGHSFDKYDLMYNNGHANVKLEEWKNDFNDEKMIFGLVYSLKFGSENPITK